MLYKIYTLRFVAVKYKPIIFEIDSLKISFQMNKNLIAFGRYVGNALGNIY